MNLLLRSSLHGAIGLGLMSSLAYSIWAFAPHAAGTEAKMYVLIALVYLAGSGLVLSGLLKGVNRLQRFYAMFLPAFAGYAVLWSLAWFVLKKGAGEWTGAALSTVFFAWTIWSFLGRPLGFWLAAFVLFTLHTFGYFMGAAWMHGLLERGIEGWEQSQVVVAAKLGWGLFHGLGFGSGMGFAFGWWQRLTK